MFCIGLCIGLMDIFCWLWLGLLSFDKFRLLCRQNGRQGVKLIVLGKLLGLGWSAEVGDDVDG